MNVKHSTITGALICVLLVAVLLPDISWSQDDVDNVQNTGPAEHLAPTELQELRQRVLLVESENRLLEKRLAAWESLSPELNERIKEIGVEAFSLKWTIISNSLGGIALILAIFSLFGWRGYEFLGKKLETKLDDDLNSKSTELYSNVRDDVSAKIATARDEIDDSQKRLSAEIDASQERLSAEFVQLISDEAAVASCQIYASLSFFFWQQHENVCNHESLARLSQLEREEFDRNLHLAYVSSRKAYDNSLGISDEKRLFQEYLALNSVAYHLATRVWSRRHPLAGDDPADEIKELIAADSEQALEYAYLIKRMAGKSEDPDHVFHGKGHLLMETVVWVLLCCGDAVEKKEGIRILMSLLAHDHTPADWARKIAAKYDVELPGAPA